MTAALLDTHVFLWYIQGSLTLSASAKDIIEARENRIYLSIASLWEIAIKVGLGKLELQSSFQDLRQLLQQFDIETLPITFDDAALYLTLPLHHRDPFDRMLIAQAIVHDLIMISRDEQFDAYPIRRSWA
ncbi:MAG: type II toxin-antitoxin system VapC family toxin [Tildeniella nuda ZEHNDER 1965/U140]|jgi:PIN domain nuclease of toxin-antitoxin system|nr:type II toxin-antitoxin system VapC family toxin [Tildeniella nuda ZEHNDER 1965/U140]